MQQTGVVLSWNVELKIKIYAVPQSLTLEFDASSDRQVSDGSWGILMSYADAVPGRRHHYLRTRQQVALRWLPE